MTRRDILQTAHEPFGDAFYYGPERLSKRFENDEDARVKSGFAESTYRTVMDRLDNDGQQEVRYSPFLPLALFPFAERKRALPLYALISLISAAMAQIGPDLSTRRCRQKFLSLRSEFTDRSILGSSGPKS